MRFLLVSLLLSAAPVAATEFVVAPDGDDANPGTDAAPFATPHRARDAVRAHIAGGLEDRVVVRFREGVYRLSEPLMFGPGDGGATEHSVVWVATPGERVRFSGGRVITGWTDAGDGLWRASLPQSDGGEWTFRELFIGGTPRPRARYPNEGFLNVLSAGPDRRTSFATHPNAFPPLSPGAGAELVFLHDWSVSRVGVAEANFETGRIAVTNAIGSSAPQFAIDQFEPHPRFFLENDPVFLDAPGEWLLDRASRTLLYRPLPGESIATHDAVAPVATALGADRGDDAPGTPVRNLHFAGIEFEHAAWPLPFGGYAGIQASFHEDRAASPPRMSDGPVPAAVSFRLAESCSVTDSALRHLGGSGIEFGSRCRKCRLAETVLQDVSASGVIIGESSSRLVAGGPWWQAAPDEVARGNVVEDCLIERCGAQFFGGVGVWVGLAAETTIRRNVIRDLPYTGISLGWRWDPAPTPASANRVERNRIHDVMQLLSDGGAIYTLGLQPGTSLVENVIHSLPPSAGRAESNGMFLDEGTTGLTIEGNTIHDVADAPLRFHKAGGNLVRGNLVGLAAGVPLVRYGDTPETNIALQGNVAAPAESFAPPEAAVKEAGPSPEVLSRLLERAR